MSEGLTPEEAMDTFHWSLEAAAAVVLLVNHPEHSNAREGLEQLGYFKRIIQSMHDELPDVLLYPALDRAEETIDRVNFEEDTVEDFMEEVERYSNQPS